MNQLNMKKILIIMLFVALGAISTQAQQYIYPKPSNTVWDDTIKADTNYYPSLTGYVKSDISTGVVSFTFIHADIADSLSYARIEWSDDLLTWTAGTGNAALSETSTDGQSKLYYSTPLTALYYRFVMACATGDTVAITNPTLMYKEK